MSRLVLILALQWLILFASVHASVVRLQNGQLTLEHVRGPDMGGGVGGIVGGVGGYFGGREVAETVYDWSFSKGTPAK
jgi:hypothetical protein